MQQIPRPVNGAHATGPEQTLEVVATGEYIRQRTDAGLGRRQQRFGLVALGEGEVGQVAGLFFADQQVIDGRFEFTHWRITTAVRLSRAAPRRAPSNKRSSATCGALRLRALPRASLLRP